MRTNYRGLPAIIAPTIHRDVLHTSYAAFIHTSTRHLLLLWLLAVAVASSYRSPPLLNYRYLDHRNQVIEID